MIDKKDRYDSLFEYVCKDSEIDWKLAKAIAIVESDLYIFAESERGAKGIMQLMPATAKQMKVVNVYDPEENIRGGVEYLEWLRYKFFAPRPPDEKLKFTLASYNGGLGYIERALRLAERSKKSTTRWEEVKSFLAHKDCVVNGKRPDYLQIFRYVDKVIGIYTKL